MRDGLLALNPFPGLRPFESSDADRFFGRAEHIADLTSRLSAVNFLAVTGESGCGKSSLVRAGLLSRLQSQRTSAGGIVWRCPVMRPGDHPIATLAHVLTPALADGVPHPLAEDLLFGHLRIGERGLIDAVAMSELPAGQRVLVVVDQFEEVFRYALARDEAQAFVKLLLAVALDPSSPVSVVITMRSDILGACAEHRGLPEAVSRGQYLVPRLTRAQRKQVIAGPIELRGQQIEARLLQRLLNDVSDTYDDLPVLQHALARTWHRWAQDTGGSRTIDLPDYEAVGTTRDAISWHGKEACADLPGLDDVIGQMFRALTERVGDGGGRTRGAEGLERRRPVPMVRLREIVDAPADQVDRVVERFRRADTGFLAGGPALGENPTIDIAHESLIRLWDRMRAWLDAEAEDADRLRLLVRMAREHHEHEGPLLERGSLDDAQQWFNRNGPREAWVAMCLGLDQTTARGTLAQIQRYLDRGRRRRWRRIAVPLLVLLAPALAVVYHLQARQATSQRLTAEAVADRERSPARAVMLALRALDSDRANSTALFTLRDALATLEQAHVEREIPKDAAMRQLRPSPDRSRLVTFGGSGVRLLDATTLEPVGQPLRRERTVIDASITGDNRVVLTQTDDNAAQLQRLDGTAVELLCAGTDKVVTAHAVSAVGDTVAIGCVDGAVSVGRLDGDTFKVSHEFRHRNRFGRMLTALAFSQDGQVLASGDNEGRINIWRIDQPAPTDGRAWVGQGAKDGDESPLRHTDTIARLRFHPTDRELLVSAGNDNTAVVWQLDLETRQLAATPDPKVDKNHWTLKHVRPVADAMFGPSRDDRHPLITLEGNNAQVWESEDRMRRQPAHENWVRQVDPSPDGLRFATASDDGTARVWSMQTGVPLAVMRGHRDGVTAAYFLGPDAQRLVTLGHDGQAFVWRTDAPRIISAIERWALGAVVSPDGQRMLISEEQKTKIIGFPPSAAGAAASEPLPKPIPVTLGVTSWSSDNRLVAGRTASQGAFQYPELRIYESTTGDRVQFKPKSMPALGVFSRARNELLTWDYAQLALWDASRLAMPDPKPILTIEAPSSRVVALAISPDSRWFALTDGSEIRIWSREKPLAPPRVLRGHDGTVMALAFSPDGSHLVSASTDRTARVWSVAVDGEERAILRGSNATLGAVAFDAQGRYILTGATDGTIGVWRFEARPDGRVERLAALRWHNEGVNSVAFSPDGQSIISSSDDGTVRMGQCKACFMDLAQLREAAGRLAWMDAEDKAQVVRDSRRPNSTFGGIMARLGLR